MAQEQKATSLDDFKFDDSEDWSFGSQSKDNTSTSKVVEKVKAGTTIDEDDDEDDDVATNLEDANNDEDDEDDEVEVTSVKQTKKPEVKESTKSKVEDTSNKKKKNDEKDEDENEDENENDVEFESFTDKPKPKVKDKSDEQSKDNPDDEPEVAEDFYTNLAAELKDEGILENVEIPKDRKLTREEFFELQDTEIEARVTETIEAFIEKMDDDGKTFIKHKRKGGSTKDFIETYYGSGIDYDNFNSDDESQRDELIKFYVSNVEGLKGDDLEDRIQGLKDSGKVKAKSEDWAAKLKKIEEKSKEDLAKKVLEADKTKKENNKKFIESIIDVVEKTNKVGEFTISKEDKKKLIPFMTKATVKVGKDQYVPALQVKLASILNPKNEDSKKKYVLLAKLLENDFDISDLLPKIETTVTKRANRVLQRSKVGIAPKSSVGSYSKRVLADMFDEDED